MRTTRLFVDFGSTFTKLVAFDLEAEELLARVQVPSTAGHDITTSFTAALTTLGNIGPGFGKIGSRGGSPRKNSHDAIGHDFPKGIATQHLVE